MNTKFLLMGTLAVATAFGGVTGLLATMGQDTVYEKIITQPKEQIQSYFNIHN